MSQEDLNEMGYKYQGSPTGLQILSATTTVPAIKTQPGSATAGRLMNDDGDDFQAPRLAVVRDFW